MTARFYIKCPSCGKVTLIRIQMGYIDHPIRVNCGNCKITISGEYKDQQVNFGDLELTDGVQVDYVIQSSGELLTHKLIEVKNENDTLFASPFLNTMMLIREKEFENFRNKFTYILEYKAKKVPDYRIINEHYFNGNTIMLCNHIHKVLPKNIFPASNKLEILRAVHQVNIDFIMNVANDEFKKTTETIFDIIKQITKENVRLLFNIAEFFEKNLMLKNWEKRIFQLKNIVIDNLEKFIPVIWYDLYNISLKDIEKNYAITTVAFEELETIYLKCYELLSDMLPLLVAYDNALIRGDYSILKLNHKMNSKAKTIKEYTDIHSKGIKIQYLDGSEPLENLIREAFDKGIRNSIGHFDYEYEMYNPFEQQYKFYNISNRKEIKKRTLLSLCLETWKMYLSVLKNEELLYQTQKYALVAKGEKLDVDIKQFGKKI